MRQEREDVLRQAVEQLEAALAGEQAGHEGAWADTLARALGDVELALHKHAAAAEAPNGLLAGVDLTRPTLARQVAALRQEHHELAEQVAQLRQEAVGAVRSATAPASSADPLPEPRAGAGTVTDAGHLRRRARELVEALRRHQEGEADVTLESVTTDLGAGD